MLPLRIRLLISFSVVAAIIGGTALLGKHNATPQYSFGYGVASLPPSVECLWALPARQDGDGNAGPASDQLIYSNAADPHQHDDEMLVVPDQDNNPNNGAHPPCDQFAGQGLPQPDEIHHLVQVRPRGGTESKGVIQLWAAVSHPGGTSAIDSTSWRVVLPDGPDGRVMKEVTGVRVPATQCSKLGNSNAQGAMFEAAVHTGQLHASVVDDVSTGFTSRCQQDKVALYYGTFSVNNRDKCGEYRIEFSAASSGAEGNLAGYLDIICFHIMELDFSRVDWGPIAPGEPKTITGDLVFASADAPTIGNAGNQGMGISLQFTPLVASPGGLVPDAANRTIDTFGACFGRSADTRQCLDSPSATEIRFDNHRERVLCADDVGRLDLSVYPPENLQVGTYKGTLAIITRVVDDSGIEDGPCPHP